MVRILSNKDGIALIFILWVLVFLTIIVGGFALSVRRNAQTVFYEGLHAKAYYIAQAGIERVAAEFVREMSSSFKGEKKWRLNADIPVQDFAEGHFKVFIANESGKINLSQSSSMMLKMLLGKSGLNEHDMNVIVNSILDWQDSNNLTRLNGAEKDYYDALSQPYGPRNSNFLSETELLSVRGITRDIFEKYLKGKLSLKKDENELLPEKSSIQQYLQLENRGSGNGIQTFLTLEKRQQANRVGKLYDHTKININAASPGMLLALPGMTESLVQKIVGFRAKNDFVSLSEFGELIGEDVYNGLKKYVSLALSRYYTITSAGWVDGSDVIRRIKMDIWVDNQKSERYKVLQRY